MHRVGLLGAGAIGTAVIDAIRSGEVPGHELAAILARPHQLDHLRNRLGLKVLITSDAAEFLTAAVDLVVEAAGQQSALELGPAILEQGRDFYLMSVGVLADPDARKRFETAVALKSARIIIPTGALAGFDGLRTLARFNDCEVTYTSTKPPSAWSGTPGEAAIDARPSEVVLLYDGPASGAALQYPKNANLAAAVALAGIGFDRTRVRLISDPGCASNVGGLQAITPTSTLHLSLSGSAFSDNPKSSQVTVASIVAALVNHDAALTWG